jgi:hypothetical protein
MALSGKYGKLDIPKISNNEPVFILRAQDRLAATTMQMYKLLLESHGCLLAKDLDKEIEAFRAWPGQMKMPD